MKLFNECDVVLAVWAAESDEGVLDKDNVNIVEVNSSSDDGVFETREAWDEYLSSLASNGIPASVIEYWDKELRKREYVWVVQTGVDHYIEINSDDLEFSFDWEPMTRGQRGGVHTVEVIEYTVKAKFKS